MFTFDNKFVNNLFKFKFPVLCTNWKEPTLNFDTNILGDCIKELSYGKDELENSIKISVYLNENYTEEELISYLDTFNKLKNERRKRIIESQNNFFNKLSPILYLSSDNKEVWGSKRQYLSGYIISLILNEDNIKLPPFMCCALNPTGGICGPGNNSIYTGNIYSPLIIHACMHDASGYCYLYHGIGNGYNYFGTYLDLPTKSSFSGQYMGVLRTHFVKFFY